MKIKSLRTQKGITLIAFVITIIILLILAGITISALGGDSGILQNAARAKDETENASREEQLNLAILEANMNDQETEFNGVTVPKWCAPTRITGETNVNEGLVIVDKNGNEYVWIQVPNDGTGPIYPDDIGNTGVYTQTDLQNIEESLKDYAQDYSMEDEYSDEWGNVIRQGLTEEEYNELKNSMLQSIYENGGFYVGKYECGINVARTSIDEEISEIPTIKKDAYPYTYVTCSQAQEAASKMQLEGKNISLMFGIQWDLVCKFIEENSQLTVEDINSNSMEWGNYTQTEFETNRGKYTIDGGLSWQSGSYKKEIGVSAIFTTGVTQRNSILNIYDFAGNIFEWTLENSIDTEHPVVYRGGITGTDVDDYASGRNPVSSETGNIYTGFRVVIY